MDKKFDKPARAPKNDAAGHAADSLSPREYTLQRRIDSYLRAKKESMVDRFDVASLKKDLQRMINSYGKAVNNKRKNPLSKKLGYYYAILMDIEGKAPRQGSRIRKLNKPRGNRPA